VSLDYTLKPYNRQAGRKQGRKKERREGKKERRMGGGKGQKRPAS
jgi:hypothetical protein